MDPFRVKFDPGVFRVQVEGYFMRPKTESCALYDCLRLKIWNLHVDRYTLSISFRSSDSGIQPNQRIQQSKVDLTHLESTLMI